MFLLHGGYPCPSEIVIYLVLLWLNNDFRFSPRPPSFPSAVDITKGLERYLGGGEAAGDGVDPKLAALLAGAAKKGAKRPSVAGK